jgi:hypothetical protein
MRGETEHETERRQNRRAPAGTGMTTAPGHRTGSMLDGCRNCQYATFGHWMPILRDAGVDMVHVVVRKLPSGFIEERSPCAGRHHALASSRG